MSTKTLIVDAADRGFMKVILESAGAQVTETNNGDGTWTLVAVYPNEQTAQAHAQVAQPSPLATDTAAEADTPYTDTAALVAASKPTPLQTELFTGLADEYRRNYDTFTVKPGHDAEIKQRIDKIIAGRQRYQALSATTGVPWQFIGIMHMMESNANFLTHLHNGDPLTAKTVRVPKGRPLIGEAPFTWEVSALDALTLEGFVHKTDWNVATMLYRLEKYNGMGSRRKGIFTPYLWSFTNLYDKGRYISDHIYDPNSVSQQCGAAILMKRLLG